MEEYLKLGSDPTRNYFNSVVGQVAYTQICRRNMRSAHGFHDRVRVQSVFSSGMAIISVNYLDAQICATMTIATN